MFNIILPKPCKIFSKVLPIFNKNLIQQLIQWLFNKYNSGTFWQNDLFQGNLDKTQRKINPMSCCSGNNSTKKKW